MIKAIDPFLDCRFGQKEIGVSWHLIETQVWNFNNFKIIYLNNILNNMIYTEHFLKRIFRSHC